MHRGTRRVTADMYGPDAHVPAVGEVMRDLRHDGIVRGYSRVLAVRQVKVKVSRGEDARYALQLERLPQRPAGEPVAFSLWTYPPKPKRDKFSPLLPSE